MRFSAFILVALLFAGGCATHRPTPTAKEITQKREELEILGEEMPLLVRQLESLQRQLSTNGTYSAEVEARDLDCSISAVRKAHDQLGFKYRQLVKEYNVNIKDEVPTRSLQPTPDGAFSSVPQGGTDYVISPAWLDVKH